MTDLLHEKYIVDEGGQQTGVILDLAEFARLLKAASEGDDQFKGVIAELIRHSPQVREMLEELDDIQAFDEAMRASPEEREVIPFDQAIQEIVNDRH
jgi:hypothetical protein